MAKKEKVKKPFFKKWWFWAIVVIIIIGIATSGGGDDTDKAGTSQNKNKTEQTNKKSDTATVEKSDEGLLTKEKFDQIQNGMTYEEVVAVVGSEGTVMSESGTKGDPAYTVIYEFETDGFMSAATMMFQDNKLINKSQAGLGGGSDVEVTLDQFNQLQNGMTYEEVTQLLGGEGEILSETGDKGTEFYTVIYSYPGKGDLGANVTLTFQGDKLQNKSQFGLK
ncbi:DUF3862 domain-containing protein [Caldifermentibacillus hisashii]|uniref:DUF3862 domain-containing protein n=1 Tax=Caldifermentibacillus hisashii TaxID=996558 RepID=UPI0031FD400F